MKPARFLPMFLVLALAAGASAAAVPIVVADDAAPRVKFGAARLGEALRAVERPPAGVRLTLKRGSGARESFTLTSAADGSIEVAGGDDSGLLYGSLELARRVRETGRWPENLRVSEQPAFVLRGPCIGLQKTFILPGRRVYEYPYTPELFPFFYDRAFWQEYLDFLVEHRMNTLYLWNGHPFSSLVRLADYPDAIEVPPGVFARNVEMFHHITAECDRRGIWLVQMFYNIFLPKPLADQHGVGTQLRASTPLAADYTRKAIAEFVKQYPNVGLMPCLGEALQGTPAQIEWATQTILPGVLDGMKQAGLKEQPPVVFRTHAMDPEAIMPAAFKVYSNLFTETKFNGESLTTWEPRGKGQATHLAMSKLGPHLVNIHILSNLEPFRYGATEFIRQSMLAARDRLGATGLHLYPLSYWNWPDSPDLVRSRRPEEAGSRTTTGAGLVTSAATGLKQWERDWIWFEAWARYAWNPDREPAADRAHWIGRLAERYGSVEAAALILDAYNDAGECAPRIVRRFGITEGNRQTMALGMTLDQLVNPERYSLLHDLYESQAPPGERLQDFVEKELAGRPHAGETPPQIAQEVLRFSACAVAALGRAAPLVTKNRAEFTRLQLDADCIRAMSQSYAAKATAARHVLRYQRNQAIAEMEQARAALSESLEHFRTLERLTRDTYAYANSMQTAQRRIPVSGGSGGQPANFHWTHLLPVYEKELADFDGRLATLKSGGRAAERVQALASLRAVPFTVHTPNAESYTLRAGQRVFSDAAFTIQSLSPDLEGLRGLKYARGTVAQTPPEFSVEVPVRVLIGYVKSADPGWRKPPRSEFDAAAAERGGTEPLVTNAVTVSSLPDIDVYELSFPAGRHKIEPPGAGAFLVLGVVAAK
ncbi:MAG: hypothetical protein HZA93_13485 [Verrucomicrobia bacterium]|nr:hypothetical protein [Verrucomicrobiota bacterium]